MEKLIKIEGMMCQHCVAHAKEALAAVAGVSDVTVSLEEKCARVTLHGPVTDDALRAAITEVGYTVTEIV